MTRVVSGVALAAVFFALIWFGNSTVLLFVALAVGALAFQEFAEIVRALNVAVPRVPGLIATLAAIFIVPFPYVPGEPLLGVALVVIAAVAMMRLARAPVAAGGDGHTQAVSELVGEAFFGCRIHRKGDAGRACDRCSTARCR